jgi:Ca-activated chloride channel family protein
VIGADALRALVRALTAEWHALTLGSLQFSHRTEARLMLIALVGLSLVALTARTIVLRRPGRHNVVLPALLDVPRHRALSLVVHVPLILALAGLSFLALAMADPYTALVTREASYPGRRICLTIDASNSMSSPFKTSELQTSSQTEEAFFTSVAAAERFVRMRMEGHYRDLVGLVEFGSESYVVTPFTTDYDNILLSLSLIGGPQEFKTFPDQQTLIAKAIDQGIALFKAFKFLDASGNLMLIFSDGEDTLAASNGRRLEDIIRGAVQAGVPVYFVRTQYNRKLGEHIPDALWMEAVTATGGKFFAASDEASLLAAIREIDRVAAGTVKLTEYVQQEPQFMIFAALAAACFLTAIATKLTVPYFRKYP